MWLGHQKDRVRMESRPTLKVSARDMEVSVQGAHCRTSHLSSSVGGPLVFTTRSGEERTSLYRILGLALGRQMAAETKGALSRPRLSG